MYANWRDLKCAGLEALFTLAVIKKYGTQAQDEMLTVHAMPSDKCIWNYAESPTADIEAVQVYAVMCIYAKRKMERLKALIGATTWENGRCRVPRSISLMASHL